MSQSGLSTAETRWAACRARIRLFVLVASEVAAERRPRPWLGVIGTGLALTALMLSGGFAVVPVVVLLAWWCLPADLLAVLVGIVLGVIGAVWATVGIGLLATQPAQLAGAEWAALALLLLAARLAVRMRAERRAR